MVKLLPGQVNINGVSNLLWGSNMPPDYGPHTVRNTPQIQALIKSAGITVMRCAIPNTSTDAYIDLTANACVACGCAMLVILNHGDLVWNKHLVTYLGSRCMLYEFSNEPDLGGISSSQYLALWNQHIPAMRAINPNAAYIGPVLGVYANVQGYLVPWLTGCKTSGVLPDAVSYHIYPCTSQPSRTICAGKTGSIANTVPTINGVVSGVLGYTLPLCMTEWNIDANNPVQPYVLDPTFTQPWVTSCLDALATSGFAMACQFDAGSGAAGGADDLISVSNYQPQMEYAPMVAAIKKYLGGGPPPPPPPPPGAFSVAPTSLSYTGAAGGSAPASQAVTLSNSGGSSISYTATTTSGWISLSAGSGSIGAGGNVTSTVSVSTAGLAVGTYNGTVVYISGSTTVNVAVTMVVTATFSASPTSLTYTGVAGSSNPASQTVTLSNSVAASYTASTIYSWISVSPGSGSITAGGNVTSTISISTTGLAAGTYNGTVVYTSGGTTITVTVTLTVTAIGSSTLTFYPTNAASATLGTANKLYTTLGTPSNAWKYSRVGTATGYGEITSQGTTSAWAASGSIGAPTGKGFLYDVTSIEGLSVLSGNWSGSIRLNCAQNGDTNANAGALTADIIVRVYKRSSGGTYTNIVSMTMASQSIPSAFTNYSLPSTAASAMSFATGDKLYIDYWLSVTSNTNASSVQDVRLNRESTDAGGLTGDALAGIISPGTGASASALTVYLANAASTTLATADKMYSILGTPTQTYHYSRVGTATGYGEITSQGTTGAWAASGSDGAPTGKGFLFDVTTLEGQDIIAGDWTPTVRLNAADNGDGNPQHGAYTMDILVRGYKRTSGGVYTQIFRSVLTGQSITYAFTTYALPAVTASATSFATGDKLYIDIWANATQNNNASATADIRLNRLSTDTGGLTGGVDEQVVTPGYQATTGGSPTASTSPTTLSFSGIVGGINPASQNVTLSNTGPASSAWTVATVYHSGSGWLTTSPTSGTLGPTSNVTIAFSCALGALTAGTYTATTTYTMTTGGSTATVDTTFIVTATPSSISASPTTLSYSKVFGTGNPASQNVTLNNTGNTDGSWTSSISYSGVNTGWLSLSATSGTITALGNQVISLSCAVGVLGVGVYTATVTYTMGSTTATDTVTLTITVPTDITVAIAGQAVTILEGSFTIDDAIDSISTCMFTVRDDSGTHHYAKGQQVAVSDNVRGLVYTGFINSCSEDRVSPNTLIMAHVACKDNHYLAEKRTYQGEEYTNQYAGAIVTDMFNTLAPEGITAKYASRRDNTQAQFGQGTLSGVVAAGTVDDGDLELSPAGTAVTHTDANNATFGAGTLVGTQAANNVLTLASHQAIKMVGTCGGNFGNAYTYWMFWSGSHTIVSGDNLSYNLWISSTSPQIMSGMDLMFTDGTSLRAYTSVWDQQRFVTHPNQDLKGIADDQWYARLIDLTPVLGKTIAYATLAMEGDNAGTYTTYIYDPEIINAGTPSIFFYPSTNFPPNAFVGTNQLGTNGYSTVSLTPVTVYEKVGYRASPTWSVDAVGIARTSVIGWNAFVPAGTALEMDTSIDGGATWQSCTNHTSIPNLLPGATLTGRSLQTRQVMSLTGKSPEVTPSISSISTTVNPSYAATKTDVVDSRHTQTDWNAGTYGGTASDAFGNLSPTGVFQNWNSGILTGQTLYGGGGQSQFILNRQLGLKTNTAFDVKSRIDATVTTNFGPLTAAVSCQVLAGNTQIGLVYGTSGWQNNNDTYAYSATINTTTVTLAHGTNSGSGGGTYTSIATAAITLTAGNWYTIKVIWTGGGGNHKVYVDDVLYINATDTTYTAAGALALRLYNNSGAAVTGYFDNFGVSSSLTSNRWTSPQIALTAGTVGNSLIQWNADVPTGYTLEVDVSGDTGTTWYPCANGAQMPFFTPGHVIAGGDKLMYRVQFDQTTVLAASDVGNTGYNITTAVMHGITAWIQGAYSSSGTRISPALALTQVGRLGQSLVAWNSSQPLNTSLTVETRVDSGAWVTAGIVVSGSNGIYGLNGQPDATIDGYDADTSANYTSTNYAGGANATWTIDTSNSRVSASGGTTALYVWNQVTATDLTVECILSQAENAGLMARYVDTSNFYFVVIRDASAGGSPNTITLNKRVAGTNTQLGTASIAFTRGTYHNLKFSLTGTTLAVLLDGIQVISVTDSSLSSSGSVGLTNNGGTAYWYSLRAQPLGDDVTSHSVQSRLTLTSTDPRYTSQVLDLTLAAYGNTIAKGLVIPQTAYKNKYFADCLTDLAKQSNYWWYIDKNKVLYFLPRTGIPAPWPASDNPGDFLDARLTVTNEADLYRNRQIITNVLATATINESRIGDGVSQSWSFGYQWASAPTITVNGQAASVGVKKIDTGKDFYYAVGDNTIIQEPSAAIYDNTVTLTFLGTGQYLTQSQYDDTAEQAARALVEGGTGIVENVEDGTGLTKAEGDALAQARVVQYEVIGRKLAATTLRDGLTPGMLLNVFLPEHGLNDALMLIRGIKTHLTPDGATGLHKFWYEIEAISGPDISDWTALYKRPRSLRNSAW